MTVLSARALSDSETQQIHAVSLRVLSEVGVDVCHETMRAKLLAAGAAEGSDELPCATANHPTGSPRARGCSVKPITSTAVLAPATSSQRATIESTAL